MNRVEERNGTGGLRERERERCMFGNEEVKMEWFIEGPTPKAKLNWFFV